MNILLSFAGQAERVLAHFQDAASGASVILALVACLAALLYYLRTRRELGELKRDKQELSALATVAGRTENGSLLTNPDGVVQWVNEAFCRLSGHSYPEAVSKPLTQVLLGAVANAKSVQQLQNAYATRKHFQLELQCAHKNGQRYWLALSLTPVTNEHKKLTHYAGFAVDISARRQTQDDLIRLNHRNELLLNAAGEGIFGLDLQGNITFINSAGCRLTGWEQQQLLGKSASTLLHQVKIERVSATQEDPFLTFAFRDGTVLVADADYFRRKDGNTFPVEFICTPLLEGTRALGSVVVFHDISDRKHAESIRTRQARQFAFRADLGFSLAASEPLRLILQRCAQAMLKHLDGTVARIWTLSADETELELQASVSTDNRLPVSPDRVPVGVDKVGIIAKERVPQLIKDTSTDPDLAGQQWIKREQLASFAGFPLFVESRLIGVVELLSRNRLPEDTFEMLGTVADSLAQGIVRKRAEDKVAQQAALLDRAQDAIMVIDLAHRPVFWNKSAERLYGWTAREVSGKQLHQLLYRDSSVFENARQAALEQGEWKGECTHLTRSGQTVPVGSQWTLVYDENDAPKSILIVNTDLSEQKQMEAQFLRNQRMESIGTLAGGIAHDLNNILAPILMSVEILKAKVQDEQSRRMLGVLESSARRGADMVKQVLTFARGVEGERVLLQPKHLIKEMAKIVHETFPKNMQVRTDIADDLWMIMGDATQLHQVLVNLSVNARDAMPAGGIITISAANANVGPEDLPEGCKPGPHVLVQVADTGTGIPPELLEKIFEPFFTTKETGKGTGLGLATVLGIVKSHGGFVRVETQLKKGTTFLIYLPAETNCTSLLEPEKRALPIGNGELILAVDDEASVLTMTKETLENFGYRVMTAKDGTEAVAAFTAHRGEIKGVLTDMVMPYMDGPATIRVLKKIDPRVKIIAASGLLDGEKVKEATGADDVTFLMKPYTAEKLLHTLHTLLASSN